MPEISSYFSLTFMLLLLLAVLFYACFPQMLRRWVLLFFSYLFFFAVSGKLIVYLLITTVSVFLTGLWLASVQEKCRTVLKDTAKEQKKQLKAKYTVRQRWILALAAVCNIGILLVLKYSSFAVDNLNGIFRLAGSSFSLKEPSFLIPIGISFYTMQALSYLFDIYREKMPADRNLARFALYMSFFPQIMEGPICRYEDTAEALWNGQRMTWTNFTAGSQRILYGLMKKLVLADRLNLLIKNVFLEYEQYDGFVIAVSAVCYTIQLYMDFSGTMDVVAGCGQIFGITMPENFRRPFFSRTISEFWTRWHITLGTWFKDYVFYPVSMSKPIKKLTSRARKRIGNYYGPVISGGIALFCVWLCNGIWHGAGWHYIFFGMYHFVLILGENLTEPVSARITARLHISRSSLPWRWMQTLRTCILVCIGELFFRALSLSYGLNMFRKIFTDFTFAALRDGSFFTFGMDRYDWRIILVSLLVILVISLLQERGVHIREAVSGKHIVIRFALYYALIMFIVIFGAYGAGYVPVDPIYANF